MRPTKREIPWRGEAFFIQPIGGKARDLRGAEARRQDESDSFGGPAGIGAE